MKSFTTPDFWEAYAKLVPKDENAKAEGLALLKESNSDYEVLIVFDGLKNGRPSRYKITKQ